MDTVDRIFSLVDLQYAEQQRFAQAIGVTASMVSQWRRRKSASYMKYLPQIADTLGTSTEYLLTGEKKKPTDDVGELKAKVYQMLLGMNRENLLHMISTLNEGELDRVEAFLEGLTAGREER